MKTSFYKLIITCFFLSTVQFLFAQYTDVIFSTPGYSYFQITTKVDSIKSYLDTLSSFHRTAIDSIEREDNEWGNYARWQKLWRTRVDKDGGFAQASHEKRALLDGTFTECMQTQTANLAWKSLGPDNSEHTGYGQQNQGRVISCSANNTSTHDFLVSGFDGGIWRTQDQGANWHNVTDDEHLSGYGYDFIERVPSNQNHIYAASLKQGLGTYGIVGRDPYDIGLIRSVDGGETWVRCSYEFAVDNTNPVVGLKIVNISSTVYYVLVITKKRLYYSDYINTSDPITASINWNFDPTKDRSDGNLYQDIEVDQTVGSSGIYSHHTVLAAQNSVLVTTALASSFSEIFYSSFPTAISSAAPNSFTTEIEISQGNIYMAFIHNNDHLAYILKSDDWGATWNCMNCSSPVMSNSHDNGFQVSKTNKNCMYLHTEDNSTNPRKISKSVNEGVSFNLAYANLHSDVRCMTIIQSDPLGTGHDVLISGNDGGLSFCSDGSTWTSANGKELVLAAEYGLGGTETDKNTIITGCQDGSLDFYSHGQWSQAWSAGDNGECMITQSPTSNFLHQEDNFNYVRNPNDLSGAGFTLYGPDADKNSTFDMPMEFSLGDESTLFVGMNDLRVSRDGGQNFEALPIASYHDPLIAKRISAIGATNNKNLVYFAYSGQYYQDPDTRVWRGSLGGGFLFKSIYDGLSHAWLTAPIDGILGEGGTYHPNEPLYQNIITDIEVDPENASRVWVTFGGFAKDASGNLEKVYRSEDYGATWTRVDATCLPNLPVNCIKYQKGTDDRIYIGTDAGVYFRDNSMDHWEKYGKGMPDIIVYDLDINYCGQELRAATCGRGLWKVPLLPSDPIYISSNTTWNSSQSINSDVYIKSGATLTIKDGATISFGAGRSLYIDYNCKLDLKGGSTLTNTCGAYWGGVKLQGIGNLNQDPNPLFWGQIGHGTARISENSTISNAITGIMNWAGDKKTPVSSTGGIIQCDDVNFINNVQAIQMYPFTNFNFLTPSIVKPDLSYFKNCKFTIDDDFNNEETFLGFVQLIGVYGIKFQSCDFINGNSSIPAVANNQYGIYSIDANFDLKPSPISYGSGGTLIYSHRPLVNNLLYGVRATYTGLFNSRSRTYPVTHKVTDCDINDCFYSILNEGVNDQIVSNNIITLGNQKPAAFYAMGILNYNSNHFVVDQNCITLSSSHTASLSLGTYNWNTGTLNNKILNTTNNGVYWGNYAYATNRSPDTRFHTGLQFTANQQFSCGYDFYIYGNGSKDGIADIQGVISSSSSGITAGNVFSNNSDHSEGDFFNHTPNPITYVVGAGTNETPVDFTAGKVVFTTFPGAAISKHPFCQAPTSGGGGDPHKGKAHEALTDSEKFELQVNFIEYKAVSDQYTGILQSLIDGGNTNDLKDAIATSQSTETWELRDNLLSKSPYLSKDVIMTAASAMNVLPASVLYDILSANPDALQSDSIMDYLATKPDPLPEWMITSLKEIRKNKTARSYLEATIAYYTDLKDDAAYTLLLDVIHYPDADSGMDHNAYAYWLSTFNAPESDYQIAEDWIRTGHADWSDSLVNSIPNHYGLDQNQLDEHNRRKAYFSLLKQWIQSTDSIYVMDSSKTQWWTTMAESATTYTPTLARNLLRYTNNTVHEPELILDNSSQQRRINPQTNTNSQENSALKIFPNPASNIVYIEYHTPKSTENQSISISNALGTIIYSCKQNGGDGEIPIDVNYWSSGYYFVILKTGSTIISTEKLVIGK